jgi:hypothetical protein
MDSSKNRKEFSIVIEDVQAFKELVDLYNNIHKIDFLIEEIKYDEVILAIISTPDINPSVIFQIGFHYGVVIQHKREKGEIK